MSPNPEVNQNPLGKLVFLVITLSWILLMPMVISNASQKLAANIVSFLSVKERFIAYQTNRLYFMLILEVLKKQVNMYVWYSSEYTVPFACSIIMV